MNRQCRCVFDIPVFLCLFHVLQAWLLKVRIKLRNKSRFEEAFNMLYSLVYIHAPGTHEDSVLLLEARIVAFKAAFVDEQPLLTYFETHWEKKKGMQSHSNSVLSCAGLIDGQYRKSCAMDTCHEQNNMISLIQLSNVSTEAGCTWASVVTGPGTVQLISSRHEFCAGVPLEYHTSHGERCMQKCGQCATALE
jgi:hypothetical protein